MSIDRFYAETISPFLRSLPFGTRFDMALIAFHADLQFSDSVYSDSGGKIFSDEELAGIFSGMDRGSLELARRFMHRQYRFPSKAFLVHPKYFYEADEKSEFRKLLPELRKTARKYHLSRRLTGPESLYYHHGLRFAPDFVKKNIAGKLFADVGGWQGDSALVFSGYAPSKIVIFEPMEKTRFLLKKNLDRNKLPEDLYEIFPFALSDKCESCDGMNADRWTVFPRRKVRMV